MADFGTQYNPNTTRPHWGGADSDIDQHLEIYSGLIDSQFQHTQMFTALSSQRSVADRSNTIRIDQVGISKVRGRAAMEAIESQRVASDKLNITVEKMMYIRNPLDSMDMWTAPDFMNEYARNNGTSFALAYDEAHIIRLQKARDYEAPKHLEGAIGDGMYIEVELKTPTNAADLEANASALVYAHGKAVTEMTKRRVPLQNMITLSTVDCFAELLHHNKLINRDYVADNGDFAGRKLVEVNGIPIVQATTFPTEVGTNHILSTPLNGKAFDVTADDLKCELIIFDKNDSLITLTAKAFTSDYWEDKQNRCWVLDCFTMFTVDVRRADTICSIKVTRV